MSWSSKKSNSGEPWELVNWSGFTSHPMCILNQKSFPKAGFPLPLMYGRISGKVLGKCDLAVIGYVEDKSATDHGSRHVAGSSCLARVYSRRMNWRMWSLHCLLESFGTLNLITYRRQNWRFLSSRSAL